MTMAIGDSIGNGATEGSVLFVGPSGVLAQNSANLYWKDSNQSLGIGTTSPINGLTVQKSSTGAVRIDAIPVVEAILNLSDSLLSTPTIQLDSPLTSWDFTR